MNNPPAFPNGVGLNATKTWIGSGSSGMTLRDYFAAKAMQTILLDHDMNDRMVAVAAYEMADAMLKVRDEA